jgi:predicted GNAT superfamily acetyltransferase
MLLIRVLETIEEFAQAGAIEVAVWNVPPRDSLPPHFMRASATAGGVALGAYEDGQMIGMAMAFPAFRDGKVFLWSHMTGVLPDYQRRDVGFQLKLAQRVWALEHGFDQICWTFDPILRGNANFNLYRLGAAARRYHIDFYGEMHDGLNRGLPTDRLEASWDLLDARVAAAARNEAPPPPDMDFQPERALLLIDVNGAPLLQDVQLQQPLLAEIPLAVRTAPPDEQLMWRYAVRSALAPHVGQGWYAHAFYSGPDHGWYELRRV